MNERELAAAYLLGELGAADRGDFERRLTAEPELSAEVEALRALTANLESLPAAGWPPAATPAPTEPARRAGVWSLRPALAVSALVLALALGGLLGALLNRNGEGPSAPEPVIVLRALSGAAGESATVAMPSPDTMVLNVRGLPRSARGQYYELWLMSTPRETVPIASFRVGPEGTATVRVPLPADPERFRYFDLSRQLVAGGTAHSDESILRGPTAPS